MPSSSFDRIVNLLNEASLADEVQIKVTKLLQVKELTIHQESSLLDNFFEEVAAFQHDTNLDVRKVVISFIQDACHVDPSLLRKAVGYLFYLFSSAVQQEPPAFNLLRCLALALISIYRMALTRAVKVGIVESGVTIVSSTGIPADSAADIALETFRSVSSLKDEIIRLMLPHAVPGQPAFGFLRPITLNDNARTAVISLIESIIVLHSRRLPNSDISRANEGDISLDQIPDMTNAQLQAVLEASTAASSATLLPGVCLVRPRRLSEEAERLFTGLLDWPVRGKSSSTTGPISCAILEAVMDTLVTIARQRPQFTDRVVQAFETVHVTLPPHFSDLQVSAVRKKLKSGLLQLLRHPAAVADYQGRITILLTDLGATQSEVMEALQRHTELRHPQVYGSSTIETPTTDIVDHGDVDMRRLPGRVGPPAPSLISAPSPCTVAESSTAATIPQSASGTLSKQDPGANESVRVVKTSIMGNQSTSGGPTSLTDPRVAASGKFSLAEAEAALRFDDDDDDDEDDVQIVSSRRSRTSRTKSSATGTSVVTAGAAKLQTVKATDSTVPGAPGNSQLDVPPVDFVTSRLVPRLTTANVADLVLLSMVTLPDQMPSTFQSTYTPIAAAGTSAQIRHLARMLAVQLVVWASDVHQPEPTENLSQLESLLRPTQEELEELAGPGIKRGFKSELGGGVDMSGPKEPNVRVKKRRLLLGGEKSASGTDAEVEDAMIRANAARRLYGTQPMNISTLVNYNQQSQQAVPVSSAASVVTPALGVTNTAMPALPPMFPNIPPPPVGSAGSSLMLPTFNLSQPPPPLHLLPPPNLSAIHSVTSSSFTQLGPTANTVPVSVALPIPEVAAIPLPARPFSLDAITVPLDRTLQRQLARDAFLRILEGLEDPASRRTSSSAGAESQLLSVAMMSDLGSTSQQLGRMKLLTRLTTRRFGGNEFYNVLIDYAIKNLRFGFELLSKLLMQEYCRFRGFQLIGFTSFLDSRRQQLMQLKDRQRRRSSSAGDGSVTISTDINEAKDTSKLSSKAEDQSVEGESKQQRSGDSFEFRKVVHTNDETSKMEDDEDYLMTEDNIELLEADDEDSVVSVPRQNTASSNRVLTDPTSDTTRHTPFASSVTECKDAKKKTVSSPDDLGCLSFYDCLLIDILQRLAHPDVRQSYFGRFLVEAPLLTAGALSVLKRYCWTVSQTHYGFQVLRTLIELRPVGQREDLLTMLLNFCAVEDAEVRQAALAATRELVALDSDWKEHIESFAVNTLKKLLRPRPTADIFPFNTHSIIPSNWNDETCQACAHLLLGLMPQSPQLMQQLAEVYVGASPDVKRCILRMVDVPIREIGLYSVALHNLVDQCPVGAETLITRMIHLLTDSPSATAAATSTVAASKLGGGAGAISITSSTTPVIFPPASLVERVYRLYRERVHDIRCLIPVLVGLPKHEVIMALPRLVQLSEKVVKEVLTRLLHASVATQYAPRVEKVPNVEVSLPNPNDEAPLGPLKPEELLVAVHLLEFAKDPFAPPGESVDQVTKPYVSLQAILHACRVCFAERRLFTQERLSAAIGQLLEQPTLPTLFMRTVMQALALHPRLAGYVINVLVRLIRKQVWKSEKLWDGFIRCCIKTRPQSYQVLLQLPPERLEAVFQREPAMRAQVRRYVENFSSAQRIHISKSIIEVLERIITPSPPSTPADCGDGNSSAKPIKIDEPTEIPAVSPQSVASSGPGTPTRDEMPHHEVAAALAAAAAVLGNKCTTPPFSLNTPSTQTMSQPRPVSVVLGGQSVPQAPDDSFNRRFQPKHLVEFESSVTGSHHGSLTTRPRSSALSQKLSTLSSTGPAVAVDADDLEPPILPPTKINSTPRVAARRAERARLDTAELLEPVDQSPLDWSTEDVDEVVPHGSVSVVTSLPAELGGPRRPVDLEKLEADRKRLEEEAVKFKKLRAERQKRSQPLASCSESDTTKDRSNE
ncbi:symplekin [Paragonimus westermani]|uniref:Symplekin n=1 Tax=Paragonimus westermani TaxID=34504 RepID=A0A5J4NP66_9TREM|nr:symplekin [Paragonimus westermani]